MKINRLSSFITLLLFFFSTNAFSSIYYVKSGSSGTGNSWGDALGSLQDALAIVIPGDEIWIAAGTYTPSETNNRNHRFNIPSGVKIYGGFSGVETSITERDSLFLTNITILSGEIQEDDDITNNSINIISIKNSSSPVYLNSLIITQANSIDDVPLIFIDRFHALNIINSTVFLDNIKLSNNKGGTFLYKSNLFINSSTINNNHEAFYIINDTELNYTLLLSNSKIENNYNHTGGVIRAELNENDTIRFYASEFKNNKSEEYGGGVCHITFGNLDIQKSIFTDNSSFENGGVFNLNQTSIIAHDALFTTNSAKYGGVISSHQLKKSYLINCTFADNTADSAYNYFEFHQADSVFFINSILDKSSNSISDFGPETDTTFSPDVFFMHCLFTDELPSFWIDAGENITATPPGFIGSNNYNLDENSDAIDKGNPSFRFVTYSDDLAGSERISGEGIDIGCYEFYVEPVSVQEVEPFATFTIYPNPTHDFLHLYFNENFETDSLKLLIIDVNGRVLQSYFILNKNLKEYSINLQSIPKGNYFIQLQNQKNKVHYSTLPFIKL